jgi:hypothetical protein
MKSNKGMIGGLAFAVACLTEIVGTPVARAEVNENRAEVLTKGPGDAPGARSELHNVRDSERYEWLLHPDPKFQAVREPKECGPTDDAPMQADCDTSLGR